MTPRTIDANGIKLAIEDHGPQDAPPLILIRGLGTQMAHWVPELVEGFVAKGFRTVIFDNRDVGLSQRCPSPDAPGDADAILALLKQGQPLPAAYGIDDMARDVTGLMDALGIARAHVFGISMGGMIAQQLVLQAPGRLLSATIVMSACRPMSERLSGGAAALAERASLLLTRPRDRAAYIDAQVGEHAIWGSPGFPMPEPAIRAMAERAWSRGIDPEGMNRQLLAALHAPDRRPGLAQAALPCLVIHGEDDALVPLELGAEIADIIPGAEFRAVAGMGHIITPSLAPVLVDMVADFVSRRAG